MTKIWPRQAAITTQDSEFGEEVFDKIERDIRKFAGWAEFCLATHERNAIRDAVKDYCVDRNLEQEAMDAGPTLELLAGLVKSARSLEQKLSEAISGAPGAQLHNLLADQGIAEPENTIEALSSFELTCWHAMRRISNHARPGRPEDLALSAFVNAIGNVFRTKDLSRQQDI